MSHRHNGGGDRGGSGSNTGRGSGSGSNTGRGIRTRKARSNLRVHRLRGAGGRFEERCDEREHDCCLERGRKQVKPVRAYVDAREENEMSMVYYTYQF